MTRYSQYVSLQTWTDPFSQFTGYMEHLSRSVLLMSCKTIYGWVALACFALLMAFLLFDSPLRRRYPRLMQPWEYIGRKIKRRMRFSPTKP